MVRAILDGRKTQTRRSVKLDNAYHECGRHEILEFREQNGKWFGLYEYNTVASLVCPYGSIGDRLWVRETFNLPIVFDKESPKEVGDRCVKAGYRSPWSPVKYQADGDDRFLEMLNDFGGGWGKTRVSIHMPRWVSRITLEITGIRVERLKDISEGDARREGMECVLSDEYCEAEHTSEMLYTHRAGFKDYLKHHGHMDWNANPWVWVIEFKRVQHGT